MQELLIDPIPAGKERSEDARYPDGAHLTDLKTVRDLVYELQRPSISPEVRLHSFLHCRRPSTITPLIFYD